MAMSIFYKSKRVGKHGNLFTLWKFRSMVEGVEGVGSRSTAGDDVRITRVGRFLRKYKLDELPQTTNFVQGNWIFIGSEHALSRVIKAFDSEKQAIFVIIWVSWYNTRNEAILRLELNFKK